MRAAVSSFGADIVAPRVSFIVFYVGAAELFSGVKKCAEGHDVLIDICFVILRGSKTRHQFWVVFPNAHFVCSLF